MNRNFGTDLQPKRIELDLNVGQIRVKFRYSIFWEMTIKIFITEDTEETRNFDVDMPFVQSRIRSDYDSAESIADLDLEDGDLRKMLASPLYVHGRGEKYGSSHKPTASGKPEAKIIQKRGASARRTQTDHSTRVQERA